MIILINDTGVGQRGKFVDKPLEKDSKHLYLNVMILTNLTKLYMKEMVESNEGIITLGSRTGFQPGPLMAVYDATKTIVISLSGKKIISLLQKFLSLLNFNFFALSLRISI